MPRWIASITSTTLHLHWGKGLLRICVCTINIQQATGSEGREESIVSFAPLIIHPLPRFICQGENKRGSSRDKIAA